MWFTPKYSVVYHGEMRQAGRRFKIDDEDANEMMAHGTVEMQGEPSIDEPPTMPAKRGRPKKNPTM